MENRREFCQACSNQKHGVKTRRSVEHTCMEEEYELSSEEQLEEIFMELKKLRKENDLMKKTLKKAFDGYGLLSFSSTHLKKLEKIIGFKIRD